MDMIGPLEKSPSYLRDALLGIRRPRYEPYPKLQENYQLQTSKNTLPTGIQAKTVRCSFSNIKRNSSPTSLHMTMNGSSFTNTNRTVYESSPSSLHTTTDNPSYANTKRTVMPTSLHTTRNNHPSYTNTNRTVYDSSTNNPSSTNTNRTVYDCSPPSLHKTTNNHSSYDSSTNNPSYTNTNRTVYDCSPPSIHKTTNNHSSYDSSTNNPSYTNTNCTANDSPQRDIGNTIRCVKFMEDKEMCVDRDTTFNTKSKRKTGKAQKRRRIDPNANTSTTTKTTATNVVGSEKCDTERFRCDRDRFKRRTALEAYKWMTLNECRLPATKIRTMYTYDFDLSEYPGINRILKNDDLGLSTTNMGIMYYSIVRPTPELVKMFECDNKVDVLAKVADAYNRILHSQNIIAQTFIKVEWAANAEFAIFARQHRLPPQFCRTDSLWLRRIYPETVQPIPDDVPMPHIQKAQTYKLRRDVAVYIIGYGDMSQISDMTGQRFEYTGLNVYKMYYEVMANVPSYVLANCGWIFSETRGSRKRTIDTSRVYIERIPNYERLDDNHEAFFTAVEQFVLMWLNAESYAREACRRKDERLNTEPMLNRSRGTILHYVNYREKNRNLFKMFYFRNEEDYVSSMSCIDLFPDQTSVSQQTHQQSSSAVYFHETIQVASVYHNEYSGYDTVCPAHLAKSVRTDKEAVIKMLSNSKNTVNYKRDISMFNSDTVLPYDSLYPSVKLSKKEENIERIFLNKIENGGNLNKEESDFVARYDCGRLREDYISDDEDRDAAMNNTENGVYRGAMNKTETGVYRSAMNKTENGVYRNATAHWTDPSTSRSVNIAIPVENVMTDKRHRDIMNSEVHVSVDEREFVSTVYFNEAGSEKGMRLDRFPPQHLSYPDHVIRISKIKYERDNVFRLFPEHYIVYRNLPCAVNGSHTLKDILGKEFFCEEHKNRQDEFYSEELDDVENENGAEGLVECDVDQWANRLFKSTGNGTWHQQQLDQVNGRQQTEQLREDHSRIAQQPDQTKEYYATISQEPEQSVVPLLDFNALIDRQFV